MLNKKIISTMLCFMMIALPSTVLANQSGKVTGLNKGDSAPYEGVLFDPISAAKLLADKEYQNNECNLKTNFEIEKLEAGHSLEINNVKSGCDLFKARYNSILELNNKEIDRLQKMVLEKKNDYSTLWFAGGLIAGIATSLAIFYAAVETAK